MSTTRPEDAVIDRYAAAGRSWSRPSSDLTPEQARDGPDPRHLEHRRARCPPARLRPRRRRPMKRVIAEDIADALRPSTRTPGSPASTPIPCRSTRPPNSSPPTAAGWPGSSQVPSEADFARVGQHTEDGRKSLAELLAYVSNHLDHHLVPLRQAGQLGVAIYPRYTGQSRESEPRWDASSPEPRGTGRRPATAAASSRRSAPARRSSSSRSALAPETQTARLRLEKRPKGKVVTGPASTPTATTSTTSPRSSRPMRHGRDRQGWLDRAARGSSGRRRGGLEGDRLQDEAGMIREHWFICRASRTCPPRSPSMLSTSSRTNLPGSSRASSSTGMAKVAWGPNSARALAAKPRRVESPLSTMVTSRGTTRPAWVRCRASEVAA